MESFSELLARLNKVRTEQGDAAFEQAVREYAEKVVDQGVTADGLGGQIFQDAMKEQEAFRKKQEESRAAQDEKAAAATHRPTPLETDQSFLGVIRQSIPALRSQAQFDVFMAAFDALRGTMNAIFARDPRAEKDFGDALVKALQAAHQVTDLTDKLSDSPEASEGKLADKFKEAPQQFGEGALASALMAEVERLTDLDALTHWWVSSRGRIDQVTTPALRNPLIDAVRNKKLALAGTTN